MPSRSLSIVLFTEDSLLQPAEQSVDHRLAVFFVNGFGERDAHGAGLDAVLRVAAVSDAVIAHDAFEPFVAGDLPGGMHVEEAHLGNRLWADVVIFVVLRAGFETTTTSHTA